MKRNAARRFKLLQIKAMIMIAPWLTASLAGGIAWSQNAPPSVSVMVQSQQHHECTEAELNGPYGYFFAGSAAGVGPVAAVGLVRFDGRGNVSGKDTLNTNGTISRRSGSGNYQVNPNCTGSATVKGGSGEFDFDFMVIPRSSGARFTLIVSNPGAIQTGEAVRVGEDACTLATLQGTYRLSGSSFGAANSVGFRVADGAGSYYGEDTQSVGGVLGHRVVSATYTVDADCTGTSFASGSNFDSVYVADGNEKFDLRTDPGAISLGMFKREPRRWQRD